MNFVELSLCYEAQYINKGSGITVSSLSFLLEKLYSNPVFYHNLMKPNPILRFFK